MKDVSPIPDAAPSAEEYEDLLDFLYLLPLGVVQFDQNGAVTMANPMAVQTLMPVVGAMGLSNMHTVLDKICPKANQLIATHILDSGIIVAKERLSLRAEKNPDQELILELSVQKSSKARLMAVVRDVTESVQAQREIRDRSLKLDLVVSGSNDGVWIWNVQTGEADFSPRWRQLVGLDTAELGRIESWLSRVHPNDVERLRSAIRSHLEGVSQYLYEDYRIRHADGTYRWMWCRAKCHRDEHGRPLLMAGTQTDVHAMRSVDTNTGLPNEEAATDRVDEMLRSGKGFQLMIIGMPRFLSMMEDLRADPLKHLRRELAERISAALPFEASLFKLAGDFFMVVVPDCGHRSLDAGMIGEGLSIAFHTPFDAGGRSVWLDLNIGAVQVAEGVMTTRSNLMRDAWTSYRCAREDGALLNVLSEEQHATARERVQMEQEVRMAIANNWFVPYFQPIVDVADGQICGFEVLARMEHPELGFLSPARFLPAAAEAGILHALGEQMLDEAANLLADWKKEGGKQANLFLSVNIDAGHLLQKDFVDRVETRLEKHAISPHLLKLEIVESSLIQNFDIARDRISRLRALGIKIALDDFGTGYSSLEYLNKLSVDLIKIDKAFVDGIAADKRKEMMFVALCTISNLLGSEICVEGLEEEEQARIARQVSTDNGRIFGQGFLYDKPMSKNEAVLLGLSLGKNPDEQPVADIDDPESSAA